MVTSLLDSSVLFLFMIVLVSIATRFILSLTLGDEQGLTGDDLIKSYLELERRRTRHSDKVLKSIENIKVCSMWDLTANADVKVGKK